MWFFVVSVLFIYFLYVRLTCGVNRSAACLIGKTALVTGANSGLGYQIALNLASRGCRVIMADVADMEASKKAIINYTNNPNIVTKHLDLSSLAQVREFAAGILQTEQNLHILFNNAGIGLAKTNRTSDDLHPLMQINYFGHFLLTHLLVGLLKTSAPSRIVNTSSCMAFPANLSVQNLNFTHTDSPFSRWMSYNNSKLALLIASDIFARKLKGTGVTSNAAHPGFVKTPLFTRAYGVVDNEFLSIFMRLYNWCYAKDAWEGSQTLVHLGVSKKLEKVTGKYFWDCRPFMKPWKARNDKFCQNIWEESERLVRLQPEEKI